MKKQSTNTGSTFNKNMTNTETLTFDNSTVSSNICIPVLTAPLTPSNQLQGSLYIKNDFTAQTQWCFKKCLQ